MNLVARIILPVVLLLLIIAALFVFFQRTSREDAEAVRSQSERVVEISGLSGDLQLAQHRIGLEILSFGIDRDPRHVDDVGHLHRSIDRIVTRLGDLVLPGGREAKILEFYGGSRKSQNQAESAVLTAMASSDPAAVLRTFRLWNLHARLSRAYLMDLLALSERRVRDQVEEQELRRAIQVNAARGVLLVMVALLLGLVAYYYRLLVAPILAMSARVKEISAGRYDLNLETTNRKDEVGRLAKSVQGMKDRLVRSLQEIGHKNHEMEQLVYTVSHDLKSPIVTMMGFLGILREDLAEGRLEDCEDSLHRIERANHRMSKLIEDLLKFSRAGRAQLQCRSLDVRALVEEVWHGLGPITEPVKASLTIETTLPALIADRERLTQILENLFTNAIKYSLPNSPRITVGGYAGENEVRIFVRDKGRGIPPEYHTKVFGLFQRLETSTEGTGVGLAIVERIMQLHEGRVWVESKPGEGATFWLAFPALQRGHDW